MIAISLIKLFIVFCRYKINAYLCIVHKMYNCRTSRKVRNMRTITASEFRANQKKYFELAEKTPIFVSRPGKPAMKISVVEGAFTSEEMQAIREGFEQIREGKSKEIDAHNLWESID